MSFAEQLLLIAGMALVTYIPRALPLMLLSSRELHPHLTRWLEMVPPAVLSALLAPELLLHHSAQADGATKVFWFGLDNVLLLAAIPAILVGWITRSFFAIVAVGMGTVALLRQFPLV